MCIYERIGTPLDHLTCPPLHLNHSQQTFNTNHEFHLLPLYTFCFSFSVELYFFLHLRKQFKDKRERMKKDWPLLSAPIREVRGVTLFILLIYAILIPFNFLFLPRLNPGRGKKKKTKKRRHMFETKRYTLTQFSTLPDWSYE